MSETGKHLLRCLAVLLLIQWTAALEPGLRLLDRSATAEIVALCSPAGEPRSILVGQDGQPVQQAPHTGGCPLCRIDALAILPAPVATIAAPLTFITQRQDSQPAGLPPTQHRNPSQQPRAPPTV